MEGSPFTPLRVVFLAGVGLTFLLVSSIFLQKTKMEDTEP